MTKTSAYSKPEQGDLEGAHQSFFEYRRALERRPASLSESGRY